jgi:hypothetical protein
MNVQLQKDLVEDYEQLEQEIRFNEHNMRILNTYMKPGNDPMRKYNIY